MARSKAPKRWTEAHAAKILGRADRSGLSDRAFAIREDLDPQRLYWWRKRLGASVAAEVAFVEVREREPRASAEAVEVRLLNGRVVVVASTIEPSLLTGILGAVEGAVC